MTKLEFVLRHHSKVQCHVVGQILHIMTVPNGTVVTLTGMALLHCVIIMESQSATDDKDNLTISLMGMQT